MFPSKKQFRFKISTKLENNRLYCLIKHSKSLSHTSERPKLHVEVSGAIKVISVDRDTRATYQQKTQTQKFETKGHYKKMVYAFGAKMACNTRIFGLAFTQQNKMDSQAVLISTGSDPTYCEYCSFEIYLTAPVSVENGKMAEQQNTLHFWRGSDKRYWYFRGIKLLDDWDFVFYSELCDRNCYKNKLPTVQTLVTVGINIVLNMFDIGAKKFDFF